jgi:hypothetical protein
MRFGGERRRFGRRLFCGGHRPPLQPQIPLQCGLRLKPRFADNTMFQKDG